MLVVVAMTVSSFITTMMVWWMRPAAEAVTVMAEVRCLLLKTVLMGSWTLTITFFATGCGGGDGGGGKFIAGSTGELIFRLG